MTLVLLALIVLVSFPLTRNWRQKRAIDREIKGIEGQVAELEHTNSNLKTVIDYMQSNQFVEEEARTKLNYQKPGEKVVVVEDRPGQKAPTSTSPFFTLPPEPPTIPPAPAVVNVHKWLDYFFAPAE